MTAADDSREAAKTLLVKLMNPATMLDEQIKLIDNYVQQAVAEALKSLLPDLTTMQSDYDENLVRKLIFDKLHQQQAEEEL